MSRWRLSRSVYSSLKAPKVFITYDSTFLASSFLDLQALAFLANQIVPNPFSLQLYYLDMHYEKTSSTATDTTALSQDLFTPVSVL
jgi:hypothetical protein